MDSPGTEEVMEQTFTKRRRQEQPGWESLGIEEMMEQTFIRRRRRSRGSKSAKEDASLSQAQEDLMRAQVRAAAMNAKASMRKAQAMQDQVAFSIFSMTVEQEQNLSDHARYYFRLRREEEMTRLHRRIAERRREEARAQAAHAAWLAGEGSAEAERATRNRIPLSPSQSPSPRGASASALPQITLPFSSSYSTFSYS